MLTIDNLVKSFAGEKRRAPSPPTRWSGSHRRRQLRGPGGGDVHPARPVRLRQDHHAALDRRAGAARTPAASPSADRPCSRRVTASARQRPGQQARPRHGVPVLRHLAAHDGVRQRRLPAAGAQAQPSAPARRRSSERVDRVLETMGSATYADRQATKLSGGQQQRLALARAIVIEPPLLLLDEPLSNLDAKLRESLRYELKRLQRELGITSIYVTHDQIEALALSSHIAVMQDGRVVQLGRPREVYENPNTRFVAEFIGTSNFMPRDGRRPRGRDARRGHHRRRPLPGVAAARARRRGGHRGDPSRGGRPGSGQPRGTGQRVARHGDQPGVPGGRHRPHRPGRQAGACGPACNPGVSIEPGTQVHLRLDPAKVTLVPVG